MIVDKFIISVCPRCHSRMFLAGIHSVIQGDSGLKAQSVFLL